MQAYYDQDDFYRMLRNNGVVKEEERDAGAVLSRYDAAKFTVRYLGQQKVAEHGEIFSNPFKDAVTEEVRGYVAVAYALSVMKGDGAGAFNGEQTLRNAEAAAVIYNTLQAE
jgi:hypothetical protein